MTTDRAGIFHFCCEHSAEGIRQLGTVNPNPHPLLDWKHLVWLTDLETPDVDGLGLTSDRLTCDRTAWRVTIEPSGTHWWPKWARANGVSREIRDVLESYGRPAHWWVAETPQRVLALERLRVVA